LTGLYDHQGVLRFAGRDVADCLAYAELFAMPPSCYSLASLEPPDSSGEDDRWGEASSTAEVRKTMLRQSMVRERMGNGVACTAAEGISAA
jgi:hypothetical protein